MKYERMTHRMLMMRMDVALSGCSTSEDRNDDDDVPAPSTLIPTATVPCPDPADELMTSAWLMLYAALVNPACVPAPPRVPLAA